MWQKRSASVCESDADCNYAGHCTTSGTCVCDPPFNGDTCAGFTLFSLLPEEGGLQMPSGNTTWGGSIVCVPLNNSVNNDDTSCSYHMYAAMMRDDLPLSSWLSHSVVVHAVSTSGRPEGPYEFADIALDIGNDRWDGATCHNPDAKLMPDGTIAIFYMGTSNHSAPFPSGSNLLEYNQRVGVAWSRDPAGPWTRAAEPIIMPGPRGSWDDGFTTNPAPYVYPNGSVLLIYKARSFENQHGMFQGVAFAESFNGTYKKLSQKPLDLPSACEDPGIYRTPAGVFRMLTHCGCNGLYLWSLDGVHWNSTTPQQPWCAQQPQAHNTSATVSYNTRQRPKWFVDEHGNATMLLTGVNRDGDGAMDHVWTSVAFLSPSTGGR